MGVILNLTQSVDDVVAILSIHSFSFDNNEMRVKTAYGKLAQFLRSLVAHHVPTISRALVLMAKPSTSQ